jgi:hypothetical protein
VAGERQEVDAQLDDVDRHVRNALGGVEQDQRPRVMSEPGDLRDRVDGADRVADVVDGQQPRALRQPNAEVVEVEAAVIGDGYVLERGTGLRGKLLPGHQVGVVLHLGREKQVAGAHVGATPAVGHQVDGLGRIADEDHLALARSADEPRQRATCILEARGGILRELVDAAVDVRVVVPVSVRERLDHGTRLRSRGRRVEERKGTSGTVRTIEHREVGAQRGAVEDVRAELLDRHGSDGS